jgi:hypothetical protein
MEDSRSLITSSVVYITICRFEFQLKFRPNFILSTDVSVFNQYPGIICAIQTKFR